MNPKKTYRAFRVNGAPCVLVECMGESPYILKERLDLQRVRTKGFDWGDRSTVSDALSLSLLSDHFGGGMLANNLAIALTQEFTRSVIAGIPSDGSVFTGDDAASAVCRIITERPEVAHAALAGELLQWLQGMETEIAFGAELPDFETKAREYQRFLVLALGCSEAFAHALINAAGLRDYYHSVMTS